MTTDSRRPGGATTIMDRLSERDALDQLIDVVQTGESRALVVRGDPGVGKSVLLDHLAGVGFGMPGSTRGRRPGVTFRLMRRCGSGPCKGGKPKPPQK